jgi:uncharacterized protein (TIGR03435 family)
VLATNGSLRRAAGQRPTSASEPALRFAVASIKPVSMTGPGVLIDSRIEKAGYVGRYMTLRAYILEAYGIRNSEWLVGPAWLDSGAFSVTAKAAGPVSEQAVRSMLQALLADRFALKVHSESRVRPVYALVTKQNLRTLRKVAYDGEDADMCVRPLVGGLEASHCSMDAFTSFLNRFVNLGRPVVNMTNLPGRYEFALKYATSGLAPVLEPTTDEVLPTFFDAVQAVGLKLVPQAGSVPILVVDNANRVPTPD